MSVETTFSEQRQRLCLTGLELAPAQVLGAIRLVPVLRNNVREDLRLNRRAYGDQMTIVGVGNNAEYYSLVPHGLVATWGDEASAFSSQVRRHAPGTKSDGKLIKGFAEYRVMQRLVQRESAERLRFLPLHLALEAFLAFHFNGPDVAWAEYSNAAKRFGLSPRIEIAIPGRWLVGFEDALRVFEIHAGQVGMLMFVGELLAAVFVVPHPEDYAQLHRTLITDFFGELVFYSGLYGQEATMRPTPIDETAVHSLDDLRGALNSMRSEWAEVHQSMADGLLGRDVGIESLYRFGPFRMQRFLTELDPKRENHIGEIIFDENDELQYLKTFRLSAAQCRRAHLLQTLAENDWDLDAAAVAFNCDKRDLILRIENAGFGYLLHQHVVDGARSWRRKQTNK